MSDEQMIIAKIQVSGSNASLVSSESIPAGIVGAQIQINYAADIWQRLQKTVIFQGAVTKDVLTNSSMVTVPPEVVAKANVNLSVGVYGTDANGSIAVPTIWARLGTVRRAASPSGDTTTAPTLPVWAQIQTDIGNLGDLDTTDKSSLVAAINEALTKGGGEVDPATVQKIVEDYLKANPPQAGADGKDGITPTIGENGNWYLGDTDTGKPSRGAAGTNGKDGAAGSPGITPHIGANGNWYLGEADTGKPSRGPTGANGKDGTNGKDGAKGKDGTDGKSAYQYAQDGGYTGTEADFIAKLAQEILSGTTDDLTPAQVHAAVSSGRPVKVQHTSSSYGVMSFTAFSTSETMGVIASQNIAFYNNAYILAELGGYIQSGRWFFNSTVLAEKKDIPTVPPSLKNPNALTIKIGSTTVTYDGSEAKTVEIADGSEVSY